jgi:hypothetical protein
MKACEQPVPFRPISRRDELEMLDPWVRWLYDAEHAHCNHHWIDDSYGGADSGYMGMVCNICGVSHGEYLY